MASMRSQRGTTNIALLVMVALALGLGALAGYSHRFEAAVGAGPTPTPAASSSPTMAEWKLYTNVQSGFEFEYSSSWTASETNDQWATFGTAVARLSSPELLTAMKDCGVPCEASPYDLTVIVSTTNTWTLESYAAQRQQFSHKTATTLAGLPAYEGVEEGFSTYYVIFTEYHGRIYELYFDNTINKTELSAQELHILSSFRFTGSVGQANEYGDDVNGRHIGYIKSISAVNGKTSLAIDYVQWISPCPPADFCPNGFNVVNTNAMIRTFSVAGDAQVKLQTYSHDPDGNFAADQAVSLAAFVDIFKNPPASYPAKTLLYWITLHGGVVTEIKEQYIP